MQETLLALGALMIIMLIAVNQQRSTIHIHEQVYAREISQARDDFAVRLLEGISNEMSFDEQTMKDDLQGTVKFIFQPAEEGAPEGEEGGAELMVKEGVLTNPDVDVIFGLHIWATENAGTISYRPGGIMD